MKRDYKIIAIGGMISVGKSSLIEKLNLIENSEIVYEIDKKDELTMLMLNWHSGSKSPTASTLFQMHFLTNCFLSHRNSLFKLKPSTKWVFLDRTIFEHLIFTKYYKLIDIDVYNDLWLPGWKNYVKKLRKYDQLPDLYILLDASIHDLFKRLILRNRIEEMKNYEQIISSFVRTSKLYIVKMIDLLKKEKIPYLVVNTNGKEKNEVFLDVLKILKIEKNQIRK